MKARVLGIALASALALGARADVSSLFGTDNEGWQVADVDTSTLNINSSQPAPWDSGHLAATEFGNAFFVYSAPAKFLGAKSDYYGGSVSFMLTDTVDDGARYPNLLLRGNGIAIAYISLPPSMVGPNYTISLKPTPNATNPLFQSGWYDLNYQPVSEATMRSVLGNLDRFGVSADWRTAGQDVTTLDSVVFAAPEPGSWIVMGIGGLAVVRRRRRLP